MIYGCVYITIGDATYSSGDFGATAYEDDPYAEDLAACEMEVRSHVASKLIAQNKKQHLANKAGFISSAAMNAQSHVASELMAQQKKNWGE